MASLEGKGFFIWKVPSCEQGSAAEIADKAQAAGLTHVLIKVADGNYSYNVDSATNLDRVPAVAAALKLKGIKVWGWHYIYGVDPLAEANKAISRIGGLGLDGYVVDAEAEFKLPGKATAARTFMSQLRGAYSSLPIGFSSYRYPTYHPAVPYREFMEKADFAMPQVYWEQAHNPGVQLTRSVREYQAIAPTKAVIPTACAYKRNGWAPTEADEVEFMDTARTLNLTGANFYSWDACRLDLPSVWNTIGAYNWGGPPPTDITSQYISALNTKDPSLVVSLYYPIAVHITSGRTIQGGDSLMQWFNSLFTNILPGGNFSLVGSTGTGPSRNFTWRATSNRGNVMNGNDTIGLVNGKIVYHYTNFSVT